ncbi:hypothetical protein [Streptomyces sp. NBRC 110028]|uniref:hypothetical protein n=1 Tax=Streptomyces sp. NBRC 110028 TaxID=1621260 RepID=UPI0006E12CD5|nr:hypothetical protein [Streptomyces sp. NBRC 110028]
MARRRALGRPKKLMLLVGAVALAGTGAGVMATSGNADTGPSSVKSASTACDGLTQALTNNQKFIADQQANPDAQSDARIANRQAVIEEIKRKQQASGCAVDAPAAASSPGGGDAAASGGAADGDVVCAGSTVTLSGEAGAPAASSNQFPAGTRLKVTNLDNDKSTTVSVTSTSGSCALLNNAAFEQVREPGKNLIRNARIERVG